LLSKVSIQSTSALQIFQVLRFSTMMLIGIVFAKSSLSTAQIGQYETFLLIAASVTFFWLNGLIQGFLPWVSKERIESKSSVLFNVFILVSGLAIFAGLFLILFEHSISILLLKKPSLPYLNYLLIYILATTPASLVEYIYLIKKQGKMIVTYGALSFFIMFLLVVIPAVLGLDIEYCIIGLIVSSLFRYGWLIVILIKNTVFVLDSGFIRKHLQASYPLILSMFLSGSAQYIDSFIVTSYFDDATFAIFRYGAREFPLVLLLANAFSISMLPGFADRVQLKSNLQKIKFNSQRMSNWMFPLSGAFMMISHWIFPLVFNVNFTQSATIFNIYLLLIISRLLFPQTILIGLQKTNLIMWASLFEIIVNVTCSLVFVRIIGLPGVAYGTFVAYVLEKLLLIVFLSKTYKIKVSSYQNISRHLVYSLLLASEFVIIEYLIW